MTTNFTAGPWHYGGSNPQFRRQFVYGPDGHMIADAGGIEKRTEAESRANADLIAAAPELYQLVSDMNSAFYGSGKKSALQAVMARSRELLQKARGELTP